MSSDAGSLLGPITPGKPALCWCGGLTCVARYHVILQVTAWWLLALLQWQGSEEPTRTRRVRVPLGVLSDFRFRVRARGSVMFGGHRRGDFPG